MKWDFNLTKSHHAEVGHNMFSGAIDLTVDGKIEHKSILPKGEPLNISFTVEGKPCKMEVRFEKISYGGKATMESWVYNLFVDNVKISPSR